MGDVTVTRQGRYYLSPPRDGIPIIEIPKGKDTVELEPDWNIRASRPQVSADNPKQKPRRSKSWGTREVAIHLREETGRRISIPVLRKLLPILEIPKGDNSRWNFTGGDDPNVSVIKKAIEDGTYDTLLYEGTLKARQSRERNQRELEELEKAKETTKAARKKKTLKTIHEIENQHSRG